jgi:hypothetical protein
MPKSREPCPVFGIVLREASHYADVSPLIRLLRARRERPGGCRAAEQRDEFAALHVWMAPGWQEEMQRAAQKSLAVMCPACSRSPEIARSSGRDCSLDAPASQTQFVVL